MNFSSATYRGLEAMVRIADVAGADWTVGGSGLRFDASAETGTVGKYALRPLTRVIGVSLTTHEWRGASLTVDAQRARRALEDDHLRLDGRAEQRIGEMCLSVELLNLTNEDYLDVSGKPVAGRSVFVGLAWSAP